MSESGPEKIDDLMMGNVSEEVSEQTAEEIAARAAAAAQKMQKLRKDEGSAKVFDEQLAGLLPTFSMDLINFAAFLIDSNIPSLTILALVCISHDGAAKVCATHFAKSNKEIDLGTDLDTVGFDNPVVAQKVDLWWEFIFLADRESMTTRLSDSNMNKKFVQIMSQSLAKILKQYLADNNVENFKKPQLERILNTRGKKIFTEKNQKTK